MFNSLQKLTCKFRRDLSQNLRSTTISRPLNRCSAELSRQYFNSCDLFVELRSVDCQLYFRVRQRRKRDRSLRGVVQQALEIGKIRLKQFPRATHRRKPLLVPELFADLSASGNFFYCAINADCLDISNRE